VAAVVVIVVSSAAAFEVVRWYNIWSASERLPTQLEPPKQTKPAPEEPDHLHLDTIQMRATERRHLLDGHFNIVMRMDDLTEDCRDVFESSFLTRSGAAVPKEITKLADPGQDFEATDAIRGGLPFRRLIFAGLGSKTCFVYYEIGGAIYPPRSCLAIVDYGKGKAIWVGESRKKAGNLKELRGIFGKGFFADTYGPVC
jgi:hypothetical protein